MGITKQTWDILLKNVKSKNKDIEIIGDYVGKYNSRILKCKCLKCGKEWDVSYRSYNKNPKCKFCQTTFIHKTEHSGKVYTTQEWVAKAKEIHPEYIYDKVEYINSKIQVLIGCKKHGYFSVIPKVFLKNDYKCAKCKKEEAQERNGE